MNILIFCNIFEIFFNDKLFNKNMSEIFFFLFISFFLSDLQNKDIFFTFI